MNRVRRRLPVVAVAIAGAALGIACGEARDGGAGVAVTGTTAGDPQGHTHTVPGQTVVPTAPPVESSVDVIADEYSFAVTRASSDEGTVEFDLRNQGDRRHELKVLRTAAEGPPARRGDRVDESEKVAELPPVAPGSSGRLLLRLPRGGYVLICNLPGHYARGMSARFKVT